MRSNRVRKESAGLAARGTRAFTLIELMVVIAIITLLISILLPSLSKARDHAKNVKTKAMLKAIGDSLEMYRNDNETDKTAKATNGYPPSAMGEDPAVTGTGDFIVGANWLVRYLMGKDLAGYAPRRNVPAALLNPGGQDEEVPWYGYDTNGKPVVDRVGPYLDNQAVKVVRTMDLDQGPGNTPSNNFKTREEQVIVDQFGYPVLYYVSNPVQASKPHANIASFDGTVPGIFTMKDNALFTGLCQGTMCNLNGWDFGEAPKHYLGDFGAYNPPDVIHIRDNVKTFPYYILDRDLYDASYNTDNPNQTTATPYRKDSFLLITAGKDGIFGSSDDVNNFR